jgi:hypothetical protein
MDDRRDGDAEKIVKTIESGGTNHLPRLNENHATVVERAEEYLNELRL